MARINTRFGTYMTQMQRKTSATDKTEYFLAWSLGLEASSSEAVDQRIREGFSIQELDRLQNTLELDSAEVANILGISERTLARRRDAGQLTPGESDRLYRTARLLERATDVLGAVAEARTWLKSPQWGLGDRIPLEYAETDAGARDTEDLLGRIDYGVLA